jgi:hypothetical protein
MKKTYLFSIWLLLLFMPTVYAGQVFKVHKSDIYPSFDYSLEEIRQITFADGQLLVHSVDGTYKDHTLSAIQKISFSEKTESEKGDGTSVSDGLADKQAMVAYITPSGEVVVESEAKILSLTLYDVSGKRLLHTLVSGNSSSLSVSGIPSGVYLLQITTEQGIVVKKIIKS